MTQSHRRWRDCFFIIPLVSHCFVPCSSPASYNIFPWGLKENNHSFKGARANFISLYGPSIQDVSSVQSPSPCSFLRHETWKSNVHCLTPSVVSIPVRDAFLQQWLGMLLITCGGSNSNPLSSLTVLMLRRGLALLWVLYASPWVGCCLSFVLFAKLCVVESSFLYCS